MAENVPPPPRGPSPTAGISPPSLETWKIETKSRGIGRNRRRGGGLLRVFYLCRINQNGNFPIFGGCRGDFGGILGGFGDSKMAPTPPPPQGKFRIKMAPNERGVLPLPHRERGGSGNSGEWFSSKLEFGGFFSSELGIWGFSLKCEFWWGFSAKFEFWGFLFPQNLKFGIFFLKA